MAKVKVNGGSIWIAFMIASAALIATATRVQAAEEVTTFEGTWRMEALEEDGESPPEEYVQSLLLTVKGPRWTMQSGDERIASGTFSMNAETHTIDRIDLEGKNAKKEFHGIYELKDESLRLCWSAAGEPRPDKFASPKGLGRELDTLKRVAAAK